LVVGTVGVIQLAEHAVQCMQEDPSDVPAMMLVALDHVEEIVYIHIPTFDRR
jgi:hypothetical protein